MQGGRPYCVQGASVRYRADVLPAGQDLGSRLSMVAEVNFGALRGMYDCS